MVYDQLPPIDEEEKVFWSDGADGDAKRGLYHASCWIYEKDMRIDTE